MPQWPETVGTPAVMCRRRELAAVRTFLERPQRTARGLVLSGDAGLGKTTLWNLAVEAAVAGGWNVLSCRASATERTLDFVGLGDLFAGLDPAALADLSPAKRGALEEVLLIGAATTGPETDLRAVCAATLDVLTRLAVSPLLIAIDDWNWLDASTASALAYAARRLRAAAPVFLLTERTDPDADAPAAGDRDALGGALELEHLEVSPLSQEAIVDILAKGLDLNLPHRRAEQLHRLTGGNPLFALELGRALAGRPRPEDDEDVVAQLPARLEAMMTARLQRLAPEVRTTLLTVTLGRDLSVDQVIGIVGDAALSAARRAQVLTGDRSALRPAHPLLGEVAARLSRSEERRDLHRRIAAVVEAPERVAFHLAAGTEGPDPAVAEQVHVAAVRAGRRGALASALELGRRALALTPAEAPERVERLLSLAEHMIRAGQLKRAGDLLEPIVATLSPGPQRGHVRYLLSYAVEQDLIAGLRAAATEVTEPIPLRASILNVLASSLAVGRCQQLEEAATLARESLAIATRHAAVREAHGARAVQAWVSMMRGADPPDSTTGPHDTDGDLPLHAGTARPAAVALMWRGHISESRERLSTLLALADDRGEQDSYFVFRHQLCELELRAGRWAQVSRWLGEWSNDQGEGQSAGAALTRCRAMLAVGSGDLAGGAELARGLTQADSQINVWHHLEALRILGLAELLNGEPAAAVVPLREVWAFTRREGIDNPGAFPVAADLIQSLAATGALAEAQEVCVALAELAHAQQHPWAQAAAAVAAGYLAQAGGDLEAAAVGFTEAARRFAALELGFDEARALAACGAIERRLRRRSAARVSLEAAVARFDALGCPVHARPARAELARLGGRTPAGRNLTPTEQRVADLIIQGRSNKEVATELVVSVSAVEAHLTRIYAKLGVRSRSALAAALAGGRVVASTP